MKSSIISMVIVLCVLAIVPMLLLDNSSVLAGFVRGVFGGADERAKAPKNITTVKTNEKVQVYKWRDEYGVMQFTNTPPLHTQEFEIVELSPDTNIVKAVEVPEEEPEQKRSGPAVMMTGNPHTPGGMKDLLETTSSLAADMNQKQLEQQQQLMEQIMGTKK
jgi:hypothetical protein